MEYQHHRAREPTEKGGALKRCVLAVQKQTPIKRGSRGTWGNTTSPEPNILTKVHGRTGNPNPPYIGGRELGTAVFMLEGVFSFFLNVRVVLWRRRKSEKVKIVTRLHEKKVRKTVQLSCVEVFNVAGSSFPSQRD